MLAFSLLVDLVFAALQCAAPPPAPPPAALLLTSSSLQLLDQAGSRDLITLLPSSSLPSSALRAPQLYNKCEEEEAARGGGGDSSTEGRRRRKQLPCRWLHSTGGGAEVKVLRLPRHALHILPPPARDRRQVTHTHTHTLTLTHTITVQHCAAWHSAGGLLALEQT
jgi:hypothetical protein